MSSTADDPPLFARLPFVWGGGPREYADDEGVPSIGRSSDAHLLKPANGHPNAAAADRNGVEAAQRPLSPTPHDFLGLDDAAGPDRPRSTARPEPAVAATRRPAPDADLLPPWARSASGRKALARIKSPSLRLHYEIVEFCRFVAPTDMEVAAREAAVARVASVVASIWPHASTDVFGSYATGLYLPTSDVDLVVMRSRCPSPADGCRALGQALSRRGVAKDIQVIAKARVPIVKFTEASSDFKFDISFDVANGPEAAGFVATAMATEPALRPLALVLKVFLQQRELNEVYTGGLGSYATLVMLLAHLQAHPSRNGGQPEASLGTLLVDFLDLYGRALNVTSVGVSCRGDGAFYLKSRRGFANAERPWLLSVEDPQDPENDIGRNSYNITKVLDAFKYAHDVLTAPDAGAGGTVTGARDTPLGRLIRQDAALWERAAALGGGPRALHPPGPRGMKRSAGGDDDASRGGNGDGDDGAPLPRKKPRRAPSPEEEEGQVRGNGRSTPLGRVRLAPPPPVSARPRR